MGDADLTQLVADLKLDKHQDKLTEARILTIRDLLNATDENITAMGLPKGPTVRLRAKIKEIKDAGGVFTRPAAAAPTPPQAPPPAAAPAPPPARAPQQSVEQSEKEADMLCSICMDRPSNRRIDCAGSHEFCAQCIEDWKKTDQGDSCPNCRTAFGKIFEPTAHKVDAPRAAPAPQLSRNAPPPNLQRPPEPAPARALPPPVAANGDAEGAKWRSKALEEKRDVERANVAGGIARENDELRTLLETSRSDAQSAAQQAYQARRVAQQLKERLDEAQALVLADRATAEKMFADQKGELAKEKSRSAGMEDEMRRLRQADGELRRRCDAATREAEETAAARVALTSAAAQQQRRVDTMQRQLDEQLSELRQLRSTLASQQSRATNASWNEQQRRSALQQQQQAVVESQRRAQTQGPPQPTMQQQQMAALQQQQLQAMQQQQEDALRQQHAQRQQQTQQQQMQQQQQQMQMQMQRPPQPDPAFSYEQDSPGGNPPPNAIVTTQGQWTCPHCTFSNATHRTSRTAANLCICELCNMTSRSA